MSAVACWKGIAGDVLDAAGVVDVGDGLLAIPYRALDGHTLRTRLVAPFGRRWWAPDGEGVHLFGVETIAGADTSTPVLVCEGESDALAAREHLPECIALGAPGASSFLPVWRFLLKDFSLVYAIGDGDEAGRSFVGRVRQVLPWARPVLCPAGRDLRELLQAGELAFARALLVETDYLARLEAAVMGAPDLVTCVRWLREGLPSGVRAIAVAKPGSTLEIGHPRRELPAPFTTYLVECPRCSGERPFVWRIDAYLCDGCGGNLL